MLEEWRDISGFEGYYQVSNEGHVRSLERVDNNGKIVKAKIRVLQANLHGYLFVNLYVAPIRKTFTVHKLVAQAFLGPRPEGCEIHHVNGNQLDNRASNLQYLSSKAHAATMQKAKGTKHGLAKLTEQSASQIRVLYATGEYSHDDLAKKFGVGTTTIGNVISRKVWRHIP